MTNAVITWIEKEAGILKTDVIAIEPAIIAWAKAFLADITPVIKQAAEDAVLAAVATPGAGEVKFAAAVATATADLASKGIPVVDNDLKAAVQIAYKALPKPIQDNVAAQAAEGAIDANIDDVAAKIGA